LQEPVGAEGEVIVVGDDDTITKTGEHGIARSDAIDTSQERARGVGRRDSYTSMLSHYADGRSDNDNRQHERKEAWLEAQLSRVVIKQARERGLRGLRLMQTRRKQPRDGEHARAGQEHVAQVETVKRPSHLVALEHHKTRLREQRERREHDEHDKRRAEQREGRLDHASSSSRRFWMSASRSSSSTAEASETFSASIAITWWPPTASSNTSRAVDSMNSSRVSFGE